MPRRQARPQNGAQRTNETPNEPKRVRLDALATSPALQVRAGLDPGTVRRLADAYQSEAAAVPPIVVGVVQGRAYVLDGHHRVEALRQIGRTDTDAIVAEMCWAGAQGRAAAANLAHGLNLKPRERQAAQRRIVAAYLAQRRHLEGRRGYAKSFREIEAELGGVMSYSTIRRIILNHHPKVAAAYWSREVEKAGEGGGNALDPDATARELLQQHLAQAVALIRGMRDPQTQGEAAQELLEAAERARREYPCEVVEGDF